MALPALGLAAFAVATLTAQAGTMFAIPAPAGDARGQLSNLRESVMHLGACHAAGQRTCSQNPWHDG
jgi:hypothetical protein